MSPHRGQPLLKRGPEPENAVGALVLVHGRGGSAADILTLVDEFGAESWACVAPSAAGHTWYPYSFMAPIDTNEPGLSSGLAVVQGLVESLEQRLGSPAKIVVLGFSQGGCLGLEAVVRRGKPIGAVVGLSSGLIGPEGTTWSTDGSLDGTVAFLGCSDVDPHIPRARVAESAAVLRSLGAEVTERIYPGMGHTVNRDELDFVREIVHRIEQK